MGGLREGQRQHLPSTGSDERLIVSLDAAMCLRLMDLWWHDVFRHELDREARNWVHELISTRNRWTHAGRVDLSDDDAWRVLDTVVRLLEPIDDKAIEPLRPMIRTLRYGTPGKPGSMRPAVSSAGTVQSQVVERARAAGRIEVRDAVLCVKHIRHDEPLRTRLAELSEGTRVELDFDGFRGTWEKMRDGRVETPGSRASALAQPLRGKTWNRRHHRAHRGRHGIVQRRAFHTLRSSLPVRRSPAHTGETGLIPCPWCSDHPRCPSRRPPVSPRFTSYPAISTSLRPVKATDKPDPYTVELQGVGVWNDCDAPVVHHYRATSALLRVDRYKETTPCPWT